MFITAILAPFGIWY